MSKTGIIILHWHNAKEVLVMLAGLTDWNRDDYQIYLVDNSGDFDSSFEHVEYLSPDQNLGFAGGSNLGMRQALKDDCEFMLLLNADTEIKETDIKILVDELQDNRTYAAVGPVLMEMKNGEQTFHKGGKDPIRNSNTRIVVPKDSSVNGDIAYLPGTVLLVRSAAVQEIGFFDENYFFSGEVADWFMRLKNSSWDFKLVNHVRVEHFSSGNESYRNKHYIYYSLRNRYLLINKFGGAETKGLFKAWDNQLRRQMIGALARFDFSKFLTIYRAVKDGRSGNFGQSKHMTDNS